MEAGGPARSSNAGHVKDVVTARLARQAGEFMAALAAGDWQVGSFMLGASVARCGFFEAG